MNCRSFYGAKKETSSLDCTRVPDITPPDKSEESYLPSGSDDEMFFGNIIESETEEVIEEESENRGGD